MRDIRKQAMGSGFTLIELLIVVAILGLLAAIAVPTFLGQRTKALIKEAETNLPILAQLEEQYFQEFGNYAPNPGDVVGDKLYYTTTVYLVGSGNSIRDYLPGFRPGEPVNLNFDYEIQVTNGGQGYLINAVGRAGGPIAGSHKTLDHEGNWGP